MNTVYHRVSEPAGPQPTTNYLLVPQQLLANLRDTPLAIGLWCLVARLFLVTNAPVPLSASDVQAYDPTLMRGAILRALRRLEADHAIITTRVAGQKHRYAPTWGQTSTGVVPWQRDAPHLGRPRQVRCVRIDRTLLDTCMGQIQVHPQHAATIRRRVTVPLLSLRDVGAYALSTLGYHRGTPTLAHGGFVQDGRPQCVPSEATILARLSQALLHDATDRLSDLGWRQLGVVQVRADADTGTPLMFVPPGMIGGMIGPVIGNMIGQAPASDVSETALTRTETPMMKRPDSITGSHGNRGNHGMTTTPPAGGGMHDPLHVMSNKTKERNPPAVRRAPPAAKPHDPRSAYPDHLSPILADPLTNHPVVQRLRALCVNPTTIEALADLPLATVEATIRAAEQRPNIRDQAGWVVAALRVARDQPWRLEGTTREATDWGAVRAWAQAEGLISTDVDMAEAPQVMTDAAQWQAAAGASQQRRQTPPNTITPPAVLGVPDPHPGSRLPSQGTDTPEYRSRMEGDTSHVHQTARSARCTTTTAARPDWIAETQWNTTPLAVQGAFRGSQVINGTITARSLQTHRLITDRYAGWIKELLYARDMDG